MEYETGARSMIPCPRENESTNRPHAAAFLPLDYTAAALPQRGDSATRRNPSMTATSIEARP